MKGLKLRFTNKQNSYKIERSSKGSFLLCVITWEEGMEKEYIITVRNTYLVKADVDEDNSTPLKKNYNEYIEFKIANVIIRIFFPIRLFIKLFIFLDKKFPRLFEYPKRSLKHIDNIMNFIYPLAIYVLRVFYLYLFLRGMIMVDQSISLFFSYTISFKEI